MVGKCFDQGQLHCMVLIVTFCWANQGYALPTNPCNVIEQIFSLPIITFTPNIILSVALH